MPGFEDVVQHIAGLWKNNRGAIAKAGEQISKGIQPAKARAGSPPPGPGTLRVAYDQLKRTLRRNMGRIRSGSQISFSPPTHVSCSAGASESRPPKLRACWKPPWMPCAPAGCSTKSVSGSTGTRWTSDGSYPTSRRCSTTRRCSPWPTSKRSRRRGEPRYGRVAGEIFEYVLRDMTDPEGGFYSAEDADSEGEEGLFYVWTPREVEEILGKEVGEGLLQVLRHHSRRKFRGACEYSAPSPNPSPRRLGRGEWTRVRWMLCSKKAEGNSLQHGRSGSTPSRTTRSSPPGTA